MDIKTVKHIAGLSYLLLSEDEMKRLAKELSAILDYVSELNEVDTSGVSATARQAASRNVFRSDEKASKPHPELALKLVNAAPDKEDGYVKVKAVL